MTDQERKSIIREILDLLVLLGLVEEEEVLHNREAE